MKFHWLLLLCFLIMPFSSDAQKNDSIVIVYVISDQSEFAARGILVTVTKGDSTFEITSDHDGLASFTSERFGELKAVFTHPFYAKHTTIEEIYKDTQLDTLRFNVALTSMRSLDLEEIQILAPGTPELVYSSKKLSVQDFEIIDANNIILLAYPKLLKKGSQLLLYDMAKMVKDSIEITEEAIELKRDYEGNIYLIHENGCKRVVVNNNKLSTIDISIYYLNRFVLPIVGTTQHKMFFSTYDALYPAFDYFFLNVGDSVYQKFASVSDDEMLEQYRAEYVFVDMRDRIAVRQKLQAKNEELATGVDAEVIYGRRYFTQSIYFRPPFAPMFQIDNSFYLFDYHCDSLKTYNANGDFQNGLPITHDFDERKSGWQKNLIKDRVKDVIYAVYKRGGFHYLNAINLSDGQLADPIKLNHRYIEGVQVYNGFIYYVYRPFESYQKKFFWRERLPM